MKKIIASLAILALSGPAVWAGGDITPVEQPVVADRSGFYVGLGYGYFKQSNSDLQGYADVDFKDSTMLFQAGYRYNDYIAFEGRYWLGFGDITQSGGNNPGDYSGDFDSWGLYLKPIYPISESFDVYALLGYAKTKIDYDNGFYWHNDGFSWGLGGQYAVTDHFQLFADYVNLGYNNSVDVQGKGSIDGDINPYTINVGISYKF